jgi:hypothetical protein
MSTSLVDQQLRREARQFELRFGCESCVHFAPESGSCGNGYPTKPHLLIDLERVAALEFCKEFEVA